MAKHRANVGLEYNGKTVEAGAIVDDIPAKSLKWLVEQNLVSPMDAKIAPKSEPAAPAAEEEGA